MNYFLSIETTNEVCSVAIWKNDTIICFQECHIKQSHASLLMPLIESILRISCISKKELSAIAISAGPGSYTGLRIGTSTAKGLCYALGIPLLSLPTFTFWAEYMKRYNFENFLLCPVMDARRMDVYCSIFDNTLQTIQATECKTIDKNSFGNLLEKQKILFFGIGIEKIQNTINPTPNAFFRDHYPSAYYMGKMCYQKYVEKKTENIIYYEPMYLKEFQIKNE